MKYHLEHVTYELRNECFPLVKMNDKETGFLPREARPTWDAFINSDQFMAMTLRTDENKLVGCMMLSIGPWTHYEDLLIAQQLTMYIIPEYRRHTIKFLTESEKRLKSLGVKYILQSAPLGSRFGELLSHRDYIPNNIDYIKEIR